MSGEILLRKNSNSHWTCTLHLIVRVVPAFLADMVAKQYAADDRRWCLTRHAQASRVIAVGRGDWAKGSTSSTQPEL